ncbi:hypothetical protein RRG08_053267 [Elysia crispata]|uniref:Uncharacterized protein n=1 Tax=Elysia crispata TaxID=231223 RepID=A0AAE1ANC7_9GAST|nr:hypothetical protein RRG08_053267 [Elysia crispata]
MAGETRKTGSSGASAGQDLVRQAKTAWLRPRGLVNTRQGRAWNTRHRTATHSSRYDLELVSKFSVASACHESLHPKLYFPSRHHEGWLLTTHTPRPRL